LGKAAARGRSEDDEPYHDVAFARARRAPAGSGTMPPA
jgi:hypothetical protein